MGECALKQYTLDSVKSSDYGLNSFRSYESNRNYMTNTLYQSNNCERYN
jgi:hypothetical protein